MKPKFLLTCTCGKEIPVEKSQAGQTIDCPCGKKVEVPSIRGIEKLPQLTATTASDTPEHSTSKPAWNPVRGLLFTGGLIAAAISGVMLFLTLRDLNMIVTSGATVDRTEEVIEFVNQDIEKISLDDTWKTWLDLRDRGLGQVVTPDWTMAQDISELLRQRAIISGIVLVLGSICCIGSLVVPAGKKLA